MSAKMSVRIQREDFDPGDEIAALGEDAGAVASFVGLVRAEGDLKTLTLEHYPAFAEREIESHIAEAKKRWPNVRARVIHRVGTLRVGERIVFVGVSAAHRQAAFEACQFLMDYLKTRAPFWKEEARAAGTAWVEAKAADDEAAGRWSKK